MSIASSTPLAPMSEIRQPGTYVEFCRQQPLGAISFAIICAMMIAGIFCEWVAPYDPLVIGFTSSFLGSSVGAILGIASAYFGGRIDNWIQRVVDVLLAFPIIVLALVVVAAFGKVLLVGIDVNLIFAITIPIVPRVARVVRAAALSVRVMPYVDAARAAGYSHTRIIFRHMAPNVVAPYLIMLTAFVAQAILAEASLSFLGLGVTEPTAAWGLMLSGNAADFYREAPWMILFPGAM